MKWKCQTVVSGGWDVKNVVEVLYVHVTDESGSDSEGAESTSSSYSSLSDFVSEMVSSDLSPSEFGLSLTLFDIAAFEVCHIYQFRF